MDSILLVEDSRYLRMSIEKALTKAGYRVFIASDGEEGLREAGTRRPDLILLDMLLPKLGGPAVLKALRNDCATTSIPVIVLSSLSQKNEDKLKGEGAIAYFEKSKLELDQNPEALLQVVRRTLENLARTSTPVLAAAVARS